jgi:hypothetical protein
VPLLRPPLPVAWAAWAAWASEPPHSLNVPALRVHHGRPSGAGRGASAVGPTPVGLLSDWMEWERGENPPGRVISNLKTHGLRDLLETLAAASPEG